jgi:hypothetical protein
MPEPVTDWNDVEDHVERFVAEERAKAPPPKPDPEARRRELDRLYMD